MTDRRDLQKRVHGREMGFNRSGPRLVDSVDILAHLVHPNQFAAPTLTDDPATPWQRLVD
jgi:hypothetical protein